MTDHDGDGRLSDDHKKLVTSAVRPIPLEEARIQKTLRQAQADYRRRQGLWRLAKVLAPVLLLALLAAGFWHWSGQNSDRELTFGGAIAVIQSPGNYSFENVRAAQGKIWRDADGVLTILAQRGAITPAMRTALLDSVDRDKPKGDAYPGGFEELRSRVITGQTLAPEELGQLTAALRAGVSAIQQTAIDDPAHAVYAKKLCERLRSRVTASPTDPGKERD